MVISKKYDHLTVEVYRDRADLGAAAAQQVGETLIGLIREKGEARIVFASAASQNEFLSGLCEYPGIDWSKVTAFHQDEWVGVPMDRDYSFGGFIKRKLFDVVHPGTVCYLDGMAADMAAECDRYGRILTEKPLDIIILGVGENGHIAFNEPHEADFNDPKIMKLITLDERCRQQQKNDFGFASIDDVPRMGVTVTIPVIRKAGHVFVVVPGARKSEAVAAALTGPVSENCPASILRTMDSAALLLDMDAAGQVEELSG